MTTSSSARWPRRTVSVLAAAAALLLVTAASAQPTEPSAGDLESARELYKEGKELRQKGDLRAALERFKAAHNYGQTPVTGLELGKTHLQLGELLEAREVLLSVGRLRVASDETEKSASARTEAAELADQIRPRIPTIVVRISGTKAPAEPQVTIDGAPTPVVSASSMRKVNPGEHAVLVRANGREEKQSVSVAEGETKELAIAITDASPPAAREGGPTIGMVERSPERSIHVMTWIGLGIGAVGLGVGAVTGALALGKADSVTEACQGTLCPPSARDDVEDGRTLANVSTIGFSVGIAGLVVAAAGYFLFSPTPTRPTAARPRLVPHFGGLGGSF